MATIPDMLSSEGILKSNQQTFEICLNEHGYESGAFAGCFDIHASLFSRLDYLLC